MIPEGAMIATGLRNDARDDEGPAQVRDDLYTKAKRVVDVVLCGFMMIPALPMMFLAGLLVRLTSRGPAIYSQIRVGQGGREFVIYKLRTMRNDCERLTGARWADCGRDPRVTPIGNFLRKSHLDELPQLFNVLRGDMTLVGPRPERPEFVVQLEQVIPRYRERLQMRPGVTGLAQILLQPDVDIQSVRTKLMYDLCYMRSAGHLMDIKIITCTALKITGMPRKVSRMIMRVPDQDTIERAHEAAIALSSLPADRSLVERSEIEMQPAF